MYSNLHFWRCYSPHLCVGRRLLLLLLPPSRRLPHTPLTHHITCSHTTCSHTQLNSHTTCSHTTCHHTTCSHTTQLTHNLLTYNSTHTTCPHTTCSHTTCPSWHPPSFHVAGVALGDIHLRFTWQAWRLVTSTFVSRGRRGADGTGRALVAHRVPSWRRGCRGSLRGRRGTWWHPPSFHVPCVALGDIDRHFAWQAWHLRHWAGSGGAPGSQLTPWTPRLFAWQARHLLTSTFTLRGRMWQAWHLRH